MTPHAITPELMFCVDPGLLTGLAFIDIREQDNPKDLGAKELPVREFYEMAEVMCSTYGPRLLVVCENFIISEATAKKTPSPWSLKGIGVVEFLCLKYRCHMVLQNPSVATDGVSNDDLRAAGWWLTGEGHGNDAYRHGIAYLKDRHRQWARRFL